MQKLALPRFGDWPPFVSHAIALILGAVASLALTPKKGNRLSLPPQTAALSIEPSRIEVPAAAISLPDDFVLVRAPSSDERACSPLGAVVQLHRAKPRMVISLPLAELSHFMEILNFHKSQPQETLQLLSREAGRSIPRCLKGERIIYGL